MIELNTAGPEAALLTPKITMQASKLFGHRVGGVVRCGKYMLTAVDEGTIWVWNVQTMEVERKLLATDSREGAWVRPMLLLPSMKEGNGRGKKTSRGTLVTGWADGAVRVFDMDTWKLVKTLYSHSGPVLALVNVGGHIISTGADMTANEWDPATWTITRSFRGHMGAVSAAVGGLGDEVLTASLDGFLKLWPAAIADCHAA
jgi:WD40 repeat protein